MEGCIMNPVVNISPAHLMGDDGLILDTPDGFTAYATREFKGCYRLWLWHPQYGEYRPVAVRGSKAALRKELVSRLTLFGHLNHFRSEDGPVR
jgi:hypothetical protein